MKAQVNYTAVQRYVEDEQLTIDADEPPKRTERMRIGHVVAFFIGSALMTAAMSMFGAAEDAGGSKAFALGVLATFAGGGGLTAWVVALALQNEYETHI